MTASGVARPIKWIGRQKLPGGRFVMGRKDILPVCIKAGALDDNVPQARSVDFAEPRDVLRSTS